MKSSQIMRQKISAFTKGKRQTILVGREKEVVGLIEITFDFKKIYNLWQDYPQNMSREEVEILNEGQPFWKDFLRIDWKRVEKNLLRDKTTNGDH